MRVRVDYIIRIPFYGRYAVPGIRPIESATEFGFWNSEIGIVNYENDLITLAFHTNERPILLQVADVTPSGGVCLLSLAADHQRPSFKFVPCEAQRSRFLSSTATSG